MTGKDGNVKWEVTEKTTPTIISVHNMITSYYVKKEYYCKHEQLFGFDSEDMYNINLILNTMIEEARETL